MNPYIKKYVKRILLACFILCSGCKIHILDAKIVSMMTDELPMTPKRGALIEEEWCMKEAPKDEEFIGGPGFLDRVILKAHKKHKAKYFADVSFYQAGQCAIMKARIVK